MSRARDAHERELLRGARASKRHSSDWKVCANHSCPEMGAVQEVANFYSSKGKLDSYCIMCRRAANSMWKENNQERATKPRMKSDGEINAGKAPWCKDHRKNSAKCGCALGIHHKTPQHRAKIAKAMKGNTNAKGKHNDHGPLSKEHRLAISMAMRGKKRNRK